MVVSMIIGNERRRVYLFSAWPSARPALYNRTSPRFAHPVPRYVRKTTHIAPLSAIETPICAKNRTYRPALRDQNPNMYEKPHISSPSDRQPPCFVRKTAHIGSMAPPGSPICTKNRTYCPVLPSWNPNMCEKPHILRGGGPHLLKWLAYRPTII